MTATDRPATSAVALLGDDTQQNSNAPLPNLLLQALGSNQDGGQPDIRKQSSLLHQSSSYLKQATSGFMRWQSRRAFWSAVDQPETERQGTRVACANTKLAMAYWFKTVGHVARRHPSVIFLPLLFGCACLGGGLAGVILAAKNAEHTRRTDAGATARQAAGVLELLVEDRALLPAASLASLAREQPNMAALQEAMPRLAPRLLQSQSSVSHVRQLLLAPFAVVSADVAASADGTSASSSDSVFPSGSDLWVHPAASQAVAQALKSRAPAVFTAAHQQPGSNRGSSEVLLFAYHPVYVSGADANETWGNPFPAGATAARCGADCYDASSRTKLWGFAVSVTSLSSLLASGEADLDSLTDKHYRYKLSVQISGSGSGGSGGSTALAFSPVRPPSLSSLVTVPVQLTGSVAAGAAVAAEPVGNTEAELSVYNSEGWQPVWEGPLIAVVIVVSIALAAMLFVMLFAYWRHMTILKAMLPEKVIDVLSRGAHYYEHFEAVTVLYADVVRYTTGKAQHGENVPTYEVVKLLNDVHSMYESIIAKYGLVRIRRSGESFLCVGGCPTADEPVAVAVRVASCARDLVLATARFRGSGGFRVQIRVGLHTGPVVAAVVGSKMPRFSLFGDVVDVAYYMEATSRTMAIHVSDRTSQLLRVAADPLLQLRPRGKLDIIGQGSMYTNWLQLDALPDPAAAEEEDARAERDGRKKKGAE